MPFSRITIDSVDLSETLTKEEFESIPVRKYAKGNLEYSDDTLNLFILKNGKAKITIYGCDEEFVLYYLKKDNIIIPVESCVIEFIEDTEVYIIDANKFTYLFKNEKFSTAVIASLKLRADIERKIIQMLVFKNCKTRIASFITEVALMQKSENNNSDIISLDLSMQEFAHFIGAKRQTVSTVFHELLTEEVLEKVGKNKYKILDWNKLKVS